MGEGTDSSLAVCAATEARMRVRECVGYPMMRRPVHPCGFPWVSNHLIVTASKKNCFRRRPLVPCPYLTGRERMSTRERHRKRERTIEREFEIKVVVTER